MPSSKNVKQLEELTDKLSRAKAVYITEYLGLNVDEITELRKFSKLISEDVSSYLDPVKSINSRKLVGGTAPSQVKKEINFAKKVLAKR